MILYKYIVFKHLRQTLFQEKLAFRSPRHFDDPFELLTLPIRFTEQPQSLLGQLQQQGQSVHPLIEQSIKEGPESTSVLSVGLTSLASCLTRTPRNPVMWAHYCQPGFVVGLDVSKPFFRVYHNVCPIQFGSIIYTATRPTKLLESDDKDQLR